MTRYLSLAEVLDLSARIVALGSGALAIRDLGSLESAIAQPRPTYDGVDLYPTLAEKAAALGYSLIHNHSFVDGNLRIGHAAIEVFLYRPNANIAAAACPRAHPSHAILMKVREVLHLLADDGVVLVRARGSRQQYKDGSKPGLVTVAGQATDDLAPGVLNSILTQAGRT